MVMMAREHNVVLLNDVSTMPMDCGDVRQYRVDDGVSTMSMMT